jgi:hypothetical protein
MRLRKNIQVIRGNISTLAKMELSNIENQFGSPEMGKLKLIMNGEREILVLSQEMAISK